MDSNRGMVVALTGISCMGKTTIAKIIDEYFRHEVTILSLDELKEKIYEMAGYSTGQKPELEKLVYEQYKQLVLHCVSRGDKLIVLDYPFNESWSEMFDEINKTNDVLMVNLVPENIDEWWEDFSARELTWKRHISHMCDSYNRHKIYDRQLTHTKEEMIQKINSDKYTRINCGIYLRYCFDQRYYIDNIGWMIIDKILTRGE